MSDERRGDYTKGTFIKDDEGRVLGTVTIRLHDVGLLRMERLVKNVARSIATVLRLEGHD